MEAAGSASSAAAAAPRAAAARRCLALAALLPVLVRVEPFEELPAAPEPASWRLIRGGSVVRSEDVPGFDELDPVELGAGSQYWLIALAAGAPEQPLTAAAVEAHTASATGTTRMIHLPNLIPGTP